ncbi:metallo-mystery pair system four-Cys motif protein [Aliikangiella marina]|uniref:Metallo-mystery pair system four-Cys motif protein n=1 Tax=Aliikangiella marina TaxID=1712262 RepID=A0A545T6I6_9GAMM|nr:MbnP family copper-binding protein [Aliikangiella marina]TQV72833.1 metallo-mystery pair system four-Cys motif protein [Aliikangiella marina]
MSTNSITQIPRLLIAALVVLMLQACEPDTQLITIKFNPSFNSNPVGCDTVIKNEGESYQLNQIQFYISSVLLMDSQGTWHPASFVTSQNRHNEVVLVGGVCPDPFDWGLNIITPIERNNIKALQFDLGVPFHLNHRNPLTQESPLNQSDMFWTWQLGYKFLRTEFSGTESDWVFHLGSTGCTSPAPVRAPESPCKNPNRSTITITPFDSTKVVKVNLDQLLKDTSSLDEKNCQSFEGNALCDLLFPRVGITGEQTFFSQDSK